MLKAEINTDDLERVFQKMPKVFKREVTDGLDHVSKKFLKEFRASRLQGPPGVKARGGQRGLFGRFQRIFNLDGSGVTIFSDSTVAPIHEKGATITGSGGRKVAVPLREGEAGKTILTSSGALKKRFRSTQNLKNVFRMRIGSSEFLVLIRSRKQKRLQPIFVLKDQVKLEARLGFYSTWHRMQETIFQLLAKRVRSGIKEEWAKGEVSLKV